MIEIAVVAPRPARLRKLIETGLRLNGRAELCRISESDWRRGFDPERGVLAVADVPLPVRRLILGSGVLPVIASDCRRARRALRGSANPAVCCGMSPTDTVTASSLSPDCALLAVQRELITAEGERVEPRELLVRLGGVDIYNALLVSAVLLLCGCPPADGLVLSAEGDAGA